MIPDYPRIFDIASPPSPAPAESGAVAAEWSFCPECGSEEIHYEEGRHKQCANCGQEWFSDLDYRDVTAKNLRRLNPSPATSEGDGLRAWRDVLAERKRQVKSEGWTPEHDDAHAKGELASAAGVYALAAGSYDYRWVLIGRTPNDYLAAALKLWPWEPNWFKPKDRRRDLVKAGALILAEIERLDRTSLPNQESEDGR